MKITRVLSAAALSIILLSAMPLAALSAEPRAAEPARFAPLVERYILDELKAIRNDVNETRVEAIKQITDRELRVAETVASVSNNTVTFFFYLFVGLGGVFALWGWRSMKDLRGSMQHIAKLRIEELASEFEGRLSQLEREIHAKGETILANQRDIERTQTVHALWLQANQAPNPRIKIEFYDRILQLNPDDYETMAYKADAALQLGDRDWALSLCNRILEEHPESSLAYYQRACANAGLGETDSAIADLTRAIELSPALKEQARIEEEFAPLVGRDDFAELLESGPEEPSLHRVGARSS